MNNLQAAYNKIISMSNMNFIFSQEPYMGKLSKQLLAKAEAFEAAADCLWDKFPNEINQSKTMLFESKCEQSVKENIEA